jgi:hypothetical protein
MRRRQVDPTVGNRAKSSQALHERSESPLVRAIVLHASEPLQTTVEDAVLSRAATRAPKAIAGSAESCHAPGRAAAATSGQQRRGPHGYV